jgi:hypothetical protein
MLWHLKTSTNAVILCGSEARHQPNSYCDILIHGESVVISLVDPNMWYALSQRSHWMFPTWQSKQFPIQTSPGVPEFGMTGVGCPFFILYLRRQYLLSCKGVPAIRYWLSALTQYVAGPCRTCHSLQLELCRLACWEWASANLWALISKSPERDSNFHIALTRTWIISSLQVHILPPLGPWISFWQRTFNKN